MPALFAPGLPAEARRPPHFHQLRHTYKYVL